MAATAIPPAPMQRTCSRQIAAVCAARSTLAAAGCDEVRTGTAIPHAMMRPVSIAIPTESPTRWPAPRSASDHATLYPLDAAAPLGKKPAAPAAAVRVGGTVAGARGGGGA